MKLNKFILSGAVLVSGVAAIAVSVSCASSREKKIDKLIARAEKLGQPGVLIVSSLKKEKDGLKEYDKATSEEKKELNAATKLLTGKTLLEHLDDELARMEKEIAELEKAK
ncbi:hypothetical protein [Mycoplasma crocodyli]|uniref:Putative lipoprotein n=1 Tax=Mycoplasma crocodyli (strain ATCC 51981 / MP145) TaxID=512564 RepID=D5E4N5_MYCCM|nr:hypothetical protein [Mycoplasma crocodyli]ADE19882.1 putative lipoprotein [Mycoplasma crocodyli MP145]